MSVEDAAQIFLSTPSARRATPPNSSRCPCTCRPFLSTPSARRATRPGIDSGNVPVISIHALREEGDTRQLMFHGFRGISIHALREEGDSSLPRSTRRLCHFYPRPPRGGRRLLSPAGGSSSVHFYPRPPRGGRHCCSSTCFSCLPFLSTPSARRATATQDAAPGCIRNFYPRPPRGGRRNICTYRTDYKIFLSTPSARRATNSRSFSRQIVVISIHALREEGDYLSFAPVSWMSYFYPRPPRGGRPHGYRVGSILR